MNFMRKSGVWLSTALLSLVIFVGIIMLSLNLAFGKPDNLKTWLRQSNIYNAFVPSIIDSNNQQAKPEDTTSGEAENAFNKPEVQNALKETFTPAFIQTSTEKIIDGTYNWLEGKTPKPDYQLDLSAQKKVFADKLGLAAKQRVASLPACSTTNLPTSTDPFTINCQPPANVSAAEIQKYVDEIANSKDFLANTTITADTTSLDSTEQTDPAQPNTAATPNIAWYKQPTMQKAPQAYKWIMLAPYIFGGITLALILVIIFGSSSKAKGLKTTAGSLISAGFLVGIGAALTLFVFNKLQFTTGKSDAAGLQKPLLNVLKSASDSISKTQLYWGIGLIAAGAIILLILWLTRPKAKFKDEKSKEVIKPGGEEAAKSGTHETEQKSEEPKKTPEQPTESPTEEPEQEKESSQNSKE